MAKAKSWSEWLGNSKDKIEWAARYLIENNVSIMFSGPKMPETQELKKLVIDALKRTEQHAEGKLIIQRMKNTDLAKRRRQRKRFKGFVSSTVVMSPDSKKKLIDLQKQLRCKSQDETFEFLINSAADIDEKLEKVYKDQIAKLKQRSKRRTIVPKSDLGKRIDSMHTRVNVDAKIAEAKKEWMAKFEAFEKEMKESLSGNSTNTEETKPAIEGEIILLNDPDNPPTTASS